MLIRKLFRTAWSYKAQFISMIIMITLGMGIFLGFNMEWRTIEVDTGKFFDDTNYADYRLYSEKGFTADDLQKIESIDGVDKVTRYLSVNLDIKGEKNKSLPISATTSGGSTPLERLANKASYLRCFSSIRLFSIA